MLIAGCSSSSTSPDGWDRRPGIIAPSLSSVPLVMGPQQQAVAGLPITFTITTVGSSSCTRGDGAKVAARDGRIVITPLDFVATGAVACTDDIHAFPRDVAVTFSKAGTGRLRIEGRDFNDKALAYDLTIPVAPAR
jgi:hypothetical protein